MDTPEILGPYDIGDRVTHTVTFTNIAGAPTNPTTVTAFAVKPDGTVVTLSAGSTVTGVWSATSPRLDQAGVWSIRMNGTGAAEAADEIWFLVEPTAFPNPLA
jgi:hypothetical protein